MSVFNEAKIDCHAHILDPRRFPYAPDVAYRPAGQEIGTLDQMLAVMATYGVRHMLLVQPNSGYGPDNRCMLDAIARHPGVFKGVATATADTSLDALREMKAQGVVGIALNPTVHGTQYYSGYDGLFERLAELDMFAQLQCENDQISMFVPWIEAIPVKVLVDHCGRPTVAEGVGQAGFAALLGLARTGRVHVKLSGYQKFSERAWPFEDTRPFVRALVDAFTLRRCMWASDWPI